MASGGGNIKVVVRVRPFNGREIARNAKCIVQMNKDQTILTPPSHIEGKLSKAAKAALDGSKTFAFDKSYWSFNRSDPHFANQEDLFTDLGKPLLDNAFLGFNNCIFAYGQTGSGKSYSMMGYGEEAGVIPKICRNMFERIEEMQKDKNLTCTVEVSYLEIYNERVRDLLNPSTKGNLKVREHPSTGPYVEDLAKLLVRSFPEIENLMDEGNKARTVAATNMNETSSRSHAVFTLILTQKRHDVETRMDTEKVAKISLVDLAGSERATSTGATGARLKEGAEINRSLSTLGRVIAALADLSSGKGPGKKKNQSMVPYRDSILTWLLKDSLGGNSLTAMIAAISPADINFDETLSTLRYADSAKRIKNHAVVNEDPNARMIRELKEELAQLRSKLSGGASGGIVEEQYAPDTPLEKQIVSITQPDGTIKKVSKAEIVEQLNQSEKLYTDLNQTWEEKLQKTEEIHKEREAALEELGISIEKGFVGLSTPKKMPHLVNLSDDPLLAECLVYNLKPGTTTVGNVESATTAEIRLNGSQILHDHCVFENVDGAVTVVPRDNAGVMVNGQRIEKPKRLRSGYRIILGDFHIFRFNNPQEARAERAEQGSLLRHSVTVSQLGSPSPRPGHDRSWSTVSRPESEFDSESPGAASPNPFQQRNGRDSDWSYARREAVTAVLGTDQKINSLTDEELDAVFDDLQRIRAVRKGRPESRMFEQEDDLDSVSTYPVREKYASTGTIDNFSLDTMLTMPSTPQPGEEDERLRLVREDMQDQIDKQKEEYQAKLKSAEEANVEIEEIKAEKVKMEESLRTAKEGMQKQLQEQKEEFQRQLQELQGPLSPQSNGPVGPPEPTERQMELAKDAFQQWRQRKYVAMAETILQNAATLKEAQVMSQQMDKHVVFQFCIVDVGHSFASSYDLVLNGIPGEDDEDLDITPKPCVGIRVIDFKNQVVHLWSLQKLRIRVRLMHQMHHLENPFLEPCMPEFSRIGDVDVPLAAVFESRVQDFSLDVISSYTANPSSAQAPSTTLKFNGTDVHAQLFVPGVSDEGGATTTQMIKDFDEGAIRFESVHSMSVPFASPRTSFLRASIFAKVTTMHLDKLLSWDDMRDSAVKPKKKRLASRLPESEFFTEEVHDIFSRIQIHEISEDGSYQPVEVIQNSVADEGAYQLHQGLQRRIVVNLTHTSGETLQWHDIAGLRAGRVRLVDSSGTAPALDSPVHEVPLALVHPPTVKSNADGTTNVTFIGQWDSSAHGSLLLDRATPDKYRVQVSLLWNVSSTRLASPMVFSLDLDMQIRARSFLRQTSLFGFANLWNTTRVIHSTTAIFSVAIRPTSVKRATDLWRMNTRDDFVKGEEMLAGWTPRGVSLVKDFIATQKRRRRVAEIETARSVLSSRALTLPTTNGTTNGTGASTSELDDRQKSLLTRVLTLWQTKKEPAEIILNTTNLEPPSSGAAFAARPLHPSAQSSSNNVNLPASTGLSSAPASPSPNPTLVATVRHIPKNPALMKGGYLLMPDPSSSRWVRRYVELRKPYLHIYSVPEGDEINAVSLRNSRVDHQPQIARLLGGRARSERDGTERGGESVWAVFARGNSYLFRARGEREKIEWILRIDESYFSSGSGSGEE
ncbi:kinesin family protein-like protein [Mytilinidion resinicola]|uniref:Kinesin family protein-like protein n=1 Tax=Mytilinidion resinicola TaxID=574789 RepID=A0A6A6XZQ2_9PEZI|nr:kinesin family protein-like protein [Mytilinidion resinicola]KAF2801879.1 kinesin family protein-like protein [Mytilinidion resinicola]